MGPIVLFETSRVRLIEYSRYRDSTVCPLFQQCLTTYIVYQADVTSIENLQHEKTYIGIIETSLKKRYANQNKTHMCVNNLAYVEYETHTHFNSNTNY